MDLKQKIQLFEGDSRILEAIASQFGQGSEEYSAIERATIALWYVLTEDYEHFREFVAKFKGDLTTEQRAHLAAMGIDPDRDPDSGDSSAKNEG